MPGAVWLDGGRESRSIVAWAPDRILTDGGDWVTRGRALSESGCCLGYVGFGAGHHVLPVPAEAPTPEPEVWLAQYRGALVWRPDGTWSVLGEPSDQARSILTRASSLPTPPPAPHAGPRHTTARQAYESGVRQVVAWTDAGDCYQVNLTRPVFVEGAGEPWPAYRRLRAASDAEHGAFIRLSDRVAVLSNSPELLLEARERRVASSPIKGTRPRHEQPAEDERLRERLRVSVKDRAELTMIVDLVRNDLGRVAIPGTVVTGPRQITSHANVHHAQQRIHADLREGLDSWDALGALFPPGSVTGAPKVRACQRISELEDSPRGVYCGAIGFATADEAVWSVAIRTICWNGTTARYHVGGGIVNASSPGAEWQETVDKGAAIRSAIGDAT